MANDSLWQLFFSTLAHIYEWMVSTNAVSWTDDLGLSHSVSFFSLYVSYLLVNAILGIVTFFMEYVSHSDDDD